MIARGFAVIIVAGCGRIAFDPIVPPSADGPGVDSSGVETFAFGDAHVETQGPDQHGGGTAEASGFYVAAPTVVDTLRVWHAASPGNNATELVVGLYDEVGGSPANRLAVGVVSPGGLLADDTWYAAAIPAVPVDAGKAYWIAVMCPASPGTACSFQYRYLGAVGGGACTVDPATQCTQHSAESNLATLPATWTSGTIYLPSENSFYAAHH